MKKPNGLIKEDPAKGPKYVYVARREECGCVVGVVADIRKEECLSETAKSVAGFIRSGYIVERCEYGQYRAVVCNEPGFMQCGHDSYKAQSRLL